MTATSFPSRWQHARDVVTLDERRQLIALADPHERLTKEQRAPFEDRILQLARDASDGRMDSLRTAVFLRPRTSDWHTESTPFYIHGPYMWIWLLLRGTGPRVVGHDALAGRDAELAKRLAGRGSLRAATVGDRTIIHDSDRREHLAIAEPDALDRMATTPAMTAGDALVLGHDVLVRTDDDADRLVLVCRVIDSRAVVTRQQLLPTSAVKLDHMAKLRTMFSRRFAVFQIAQRDELPIGDYDAIYDDVEAREKAIREELGVTGLSNRRFEELVYQLTMARESSTGSSDAARVVASAPVAVSPVASTPASPGTATELASRGYTVLRELFSGDDVAALVDEFARVASEDSRNPNFDGLRFVGPALRRRFAAKLTDAATTAAGASFDRLRAGIFYATRLGIEFDWHTDTSSYYTYGRFVNLWIPLVKPDRRRSGLGVIDRQAFAARCPEIAARLDGTGSTRVLVHDGKTVFCDSDRLRYYHVDDPHLMDELACVPELGPGDVLLLASDTLHKTQDGDTDRLAVSFRVVDSSAVVTRERVSNMGPAKFNNMARMRSQFVKRLATFDVAGADALSVGEYDALYNLVEAHEVEACRRYAVDVLTTSQLEDLVYELSLSYVRS